MENTMYEYMIGKVQSADDKILILEVSGIGYRINIPSSVVNKIKTGEELKIYVDLCVREDSMKLFGFLSTNEREMFAKLQTISGIGPSVALNIVSGASIQLLYEAIINEDLTLFKKIKGVGPKTAKRIVLELKGSLSKDIASMPKMEESVVDMIYSNAVKALSALGYQPQNATEAVDKAIKILPEKKTLEDVVTEALKHL